jgi:hypothetical protein
MSSDAGDPGTTDEHPPIFSGRARPAVMTDSQLAVRSEPDYDPTVIPDRFPRKASEPLSVVQPVQQRVPGRTISGVIAFVIFFVLAMLVTAFMIALAVR